MERTLVIANVTITVGAIQRGPWCCGCRGGGGAMTVAVAVAVAVVVVVAVAVAALGGENLNAM